VVTHQEIQVVENATVSLHYGGSREKARGEEMKDSLAMLLKTNGGKMSLFGSLAILMKINEL
jgi:ABC-type enterochelin transport system substrate-binding protein